MIGIYEIREDTIPLDVTLEYVVQEWRDNYIDCPEYAKYQEEWN